MFEYPFKLSFSFLGRLRTELDCANIDRLDIGIALTIKTQITCVIIPLLLFIFQNL